MLKMLVADDHADTTPGRTVGQAKSDAKPPSSTHLPLKPQPSSPIPRSGLAIAALAFALLCETASSVFAQSTAFTYQGSLTHGGAPANGTYDFIFTLCNLQTGAGTVAGPVTNLATEVANGLFTTTIDFGPVFDGSARWLEIGVRTNGAMVFTTLTPRQRLTPSPYACYATEAGAAGTVTAVPVSALPASVLRLDTNQQINITGDLSLRSATPLLTQGFESASFPPTNWVTGASTPWVRTNAASSEGAWSAVSGTIGHGQSTFLQFTYNLPVSAFLQFDWRVDSEPGYDLLRLYIDGIEQSSISGLTPWTAVTFLISPGIHTFKWDYTKDSSITAGADRAYLDHVRLTPGTGSLTAENLQVTGSAYTEGLRVRGSSLLDPNVGIGTANPARPLQIGEATTFGSEGLIRLAARSGFSSEHRIWDIGVKQTGYDVSGAGYCFVIDDTQLGTEPEFLVHWGNGRVGIGRTNPVSALEVNGTVTATAFAGDGAGLTNITAEHISGLSLPSGMTVVSTLPNDSGLTTNGYRPMMTVPAPPWVNGSSTEAPSARAEHTATWTGQRLLVWGGKIADNLFTASGASYHPDSDQWETISTLSAPSARAGHTAVWTGDKLIVWGGYNASGWLKNGAMFQPESPVWTAVASNSAPAERSGHVSIWTGSRMVVWGGRNATGLLNSGALYDPIANQWTPLSLPNPPEPRVGAVAVWTGSRLLIWGGEGSSGVLSNGAQLVFSGSVPTSWTTINSVNAPTARRGHTAVWTGQRMIVWGGQKNGIPLGNGGAFDPIANAWEPILSSQAPAARFEHAAVWTGQEMLILGGSTGVMELPSGSTYDPLTSAWRPLSSSGGPLPRMDSTAAWTGTELLVFGGRGQGQYLSALQRLVPQPVWYFYRKL